MQRDRRRDASMNEMPRFTWWTFLPLLLILSCASAARIWYVATATEGGVREPALVVQGSPPTKFDILAANVAERHWFGGPAPPADKEESTAHTAPLYPLLLAGNAVLGSDDS